MSSIEFRLARHQDSTRIQEFIGSHWAKNHILSRDGGLLDWQHRLPDNSMSFILAEDGPSLIGLLGFVSHRKFDPTLSVDVAFLTTWMALEEFRGVGIGLVRYLRKCRPNVWLGNIGVAEPAQRVLGKLGMDIGVMQHHVGFNPTSKSFSLALSADPPCLKSGATTGWEIKRQTIEESLGDVSTLLETHNANVFPPKSLTYLKQRFTHHPKYHYLGLSVFEGATLQRLLICRRITVGHQAALRIVAIIGGNKVHCSLGLKMSQILEAEGVEYVDCVHSSTDPSDLEVLGMTELSDPSIPVVPGYFEPPLMKPKVILYASDPCPDKRLHLRQFLSDGDQDRPNT